MAKATYNVIGVMSGTSLDGVDLAFITFVYDEKWSFCIHYSETVKYPDIWTRKLDDLTNHEIDVLKVIDEEYTVYLSKLINDFIDKYELKSLTAISSHGHTALHQPDKKLTYQIGNLPSIAKLTNNQVICDFRTMDVALNGQGAPLVPIGDHLLFSEYDYCINLGGFANISSEINKRRIAFDICPVNIVMNAYAKRLGFDYDINGTVAKSGSIHQETLEKLNKLSFYKEDAPKSLGLEWVNNNIVPILEASDCSESDILRTYVEHVAMQIVDQINVNSKALFTGGGVFNDFLISRIKSLKSFELIRPDENLINFKEALIFGLLGVLRLRNEVNCLSSVTGADYDHCSGVIYNP